MHLFFECSKNKEAGEVLIKVAKVYDANLTAEKILKMEVEAVPPFLLPTIIIIATGLQFIWEQRKQKKSSSPYMIRVELEAAVSISRRSRSKGIRDAGYILENILNNFWE